MGTASARALSAAPKATPALRRTMPPPIPPTPSIMPDAFDIELRSSTAVAPKTPRSFIPIAFGGIRLFEPRPSVVSLCG